MEIPELPLQETPTVRLPMDRDVASVILDFTTAQPSLSVRDSTPFVRHRISQMVSARVVILAINLILVLEHAKFFSVTLIVKTLIPKEIVSNVLQNTISLD